MWEGRRFREFNSLHDVTSKEFTSRGVRELAKLTEFAIEGTDGVHSGASIFADFGSAFPVAGET